MDSPIKKERKFILNNCFENIQYIHKQSINCKVNNKSQFFVLVNQEWHVFKTMLLFSKISILFTLRKLKCCYFFNNCHKLLLLGEHLTTAVSTYKS